ncbi:hypothetical protein D3C80_1535660 [compost metagenome]
MRGQNQANLLQILRPFALKCSHGLLDLQSIADRMPQRLIHITNNRNSISTHLGSDINHGLSQTNGIIQCLHKRPAACFYVKDNGISPCCDFLAHDRAGDKRY